MGVSKIPDISLDKTETDGKSLIRTYFDGMASYQNVKERKTMTLCLCGRSPHLVYNSSIGNLSSSLLLT